MHLRATRNAGFSALILAVSSAFGHEHEGTGMGETGSFSSLADRPAAAYLESTPPLWHNLGSLTYPITTANERAQSYFDQGLRLTYAFNHLEAQRAFREAQRLDPHCALCYWGEALVLGPNINASMEQDAVVPAQAALRKAQENSKRAGAKEQGLIAALATRYSEDPRASRKALDNAYAEAMRRLAARFPDDEHIAVLYAEALMDLSPWDYWKEGGHRPKGKTAEIIETLERVLRTHPNHPGAIHYYIHMVEASDAPERAEPYAGRLGALMPGAGHLVHMPAHLYYRLGRYLDALAANKAAIAVDEDYLAQTKATGIYAQSYYPHNIHFLLASAQMAGDAKTAIEAAEKLERAVSEEAARGLAWLQPVKAAPYFAHTRFSPPATVLALPDPSKALPYVKAMWHYARGVAYAAQGDTQAARGEARAIVAIRRNNAFAGMKAGGVPAKEVLALAQHVLQGRIAQARSDLKRAAIEFEAAVAIEDRLPYMEPPYWYYPVRQSLGAVRLLAGEIDRAEAALRGSLVRAPNNGWALYGLMQVYRQRGKLEAARDVEQLLRKAWAGDPNALSLAHL